MTINMNFLEFSRNKFPFGLNNTCKFDSSIRVQAEPHVLIGTWYYVNESKSSSSKTMDMPMTSLGIS